MPRHHQNIARQPQQSRCGGAEQQNQQPRVPRREFGAHECGNLASVQREHEENGNRDQRNPARHKFEKVVQARDFSPGVVFCEERVGNRIEGARDGTYDTGQLDHHAVHGDGFGFNERSDNHDVQSSVQFRDQIDQKQRQRETKQRAL